MVLIIAAFSIQAIADENNTNIDEPHLVQYITQIYKQIDFKNCNHLSYYVFEKAYRGYLNLKYAGKLNNEKEIITICNYDLPSTENRLWVIDLHAHKVLFNTYVAHGQGTGEDCAAEFSNTKNSHQSSLGFYVTTATYEGEHGTSLRLDGMDYGYNDAALDRDIVVHGAEYVSEHFITENNRLGRSWGCPAVALDLALPLINTIKDGTCFFSYFPDNKYMKTAYWLNKKITHLPENNMLPDIEMNLKLEKGSYANRNTTILNNTIASVGKIENKNSSKDLNSYSNSFPKNITRIEYVRNGKIDSVKTFVIEGN